MTAVEAWHNETLGMGVCTALRKNGFEAQYVATAAEALKLIAGFIRPGMTVGFGGSMSLKAIGAPERAQAFGAEVLDHNAPGISEERKTGAETAWRPSLSVRRRSSSWERTRSYVTSMRLFAASRQQPLLWTTNALTDLILA
ncbi:MAG: LUD domain-containing protein [Spirochaetia bacterium]|jgi:hypothetical protein